MRLWKKSSLLAVIWATLACGDLMAESSRQWLFQFWGHYHYTGIQSERMPGTTSAMSLKNPVVIEANAGVVVVQGLYLGTAFDWWVAGRNFSVSGVSEKDTLHYYSLGGELGYISSGPRVYWMFVGGVFYPLASKISTTNSGDFQAGKPLSYRLRLVIGIQLFRWVSLNLGGGYRWNKLGNLTNGSISYLTGGSDFDLTGPHLSLGLGFSF